MGATINAIPVVEDEQRMATIIPFTPTKEVKYKLDGTPKKTHSNAVTGRSTRVRPLKETEDFVKFVCYFKDKAYNDKLSHAKHIAACRDYAIVMMGFESGLRISDIISRKWSDLYKSGWVFRDSIVCRQQKTGKYGEFFIGRVMENAVEHYRQAVNPYSINDYMFPSGSNSAELPYINRRTPWLSIKKAAEECGIDINLGTHSLRKTFGYKNMMAHQNDAMFLATLMRTFGHSSEAITLRYCGIEEDEQKTLFSDLNDIYESELSGV